MGLPILGDTPASDANISVVCFDLVSINDSLQTPVPTDGVTTLNLLCAVWGIACGSFLMGLPILAGTAAFSACTSIASAGLFLAYGLPIGLRLIFAQHSFDPGPFTLGRVGPLIAPEYL